MIHIKFFAHLRETLKVSSIDLAGFEGKTIAEIQQALVARGGVWEVLSESDVLYAINQSITSAATTVNDGDELAFFPPVTGG